MILISEFSSLQIWGTVVLGFSDSISSRWKSVLIDVWYLYLVFIHRINGEIKTTNILARKLQKVVLTSGVSVELVCRQEKGGKGA